ncbi:sigma-E factor negative regulatory protein [Massilia sp. CCM 9210]|uniref:sigma-E factor negative regulatory protein n=1 Tax=Massilia scottii TaxID=3057166 RepID=UPI0027965047|nr:sigma-E factor negative regulatory protein [Massilia sp. CCM 9210]MDQ1817945.1 sigma-E factor negative regulatory protein [Massilia sp. CCM 9210]
MDTPKKVREQISAFSDHELSPSTFPDAALHSADGQHAWDLYHRIRDAMRDPGGPDLSDAFASKLAARLAAEPPPGKRMLRASGAALSRRAPAIPPAAVAAGAAGPVTGISEAAATGTAGPVSGSDAPDAPDAIAVAEPVNEAIAEPVSEAISEPRADGATGSRDAKADGRADPKPVNMAKPAIASIS